MLGYYSFDFLPTSYHFDEFIPILSHLLCQVVIVQEKKTLSGEIYEIDVLANQMWRLPPAPSLKMAQAQSFPAPLQT